MNGKNTRGQKGSILAIALILVSVVAIITVTSMRGSLMQEKIVTNQKFKSISYMAAESGAASFTKWVTASSANWNTTGWQSTIPTSATGTPNMGTMGYYWINPSDVVWTASNVTLKVRGYAKSDNTSTTKATTTLQLTITNSTAGSGQYIGSGMLAGGNIAISGNASINGSAFADGNFSVTGGNSSLINGTVSAHGTASMNGVSTSLVNSKAAATTVAGVTSDFLNTMKSKAAVQTCIFALVGDQQGNVYYCNGNAILAGVFSNATVVASGNVTASGGGQMGGTGKDNNAVTIAVIAGGNITFNGSADMNAVFWAGGNYIQNGSGSVVGAIVAGGDITRNGDFSFTSNTVENSYISTVPPAPSRVTLWKEILE